MSSNVPSPRFRQTALLSASLATSQSSRPSPSKSVARTAHAAARPRHAGRFRDVPESAVSFVSIENVGQSGEVLRQAVVGGARYRVVPKWRLGRVERKIIDDEEIKIAILIEIAKGSPQCSSFRSQPPLLRLRR